MKIGCGGGGEYEHKSVIGVVHAYSNQSGVFYTLLVPLFFEYKLCVVGVEVFCWLRNVSRAGIALGRGTDLGYIDYSIQLTSFC